MAVMAGPLVAQEDLVFIQIEARSSLIGAQTSVQDYTGQLENVNGFSLGGGWYGVALGPYTRSDAEALLRDLRRARQVPPDSYIEVPNSYGQQFWPVGAQVLQAQPVPQVAQPVIVAPQPSAAEQVQTAPSEQVAQVDPVQPAEPEVVVDETPREARASERLLSREERAELQIALKWAGFYTSAIDAAFGRGTRRAMAAWQETNGFEATGILTTLQRGELLGQYNAVLEGMDLRRYADTRAGIEMELPLGAVSFDRHEAPFAIFNPTGVVEGARVLLISQPGDRRTLAGLYEIMQTLEVVPLEGERSRKRDSFLLTGANERIVSHTEVSLRGGEIKGWTMVWPAGDEERRGRLLDRMQKSFARTSGVLSPTSVSDDGQQVDLVSGLRVRKPLRNGSGFFVAQDGAVLTSQSLVAGCGLVTLDGVYKMSVAAEDATLGLAALRPAEPLAPRGHASFAASLPRLEAEVAVAGYSFGGVLGAPSLTFGSVQELQGLSGEPELKRLAMASLPGDAGGPVLDSAGGVVGMLLPRAEGDGRILPENVNFAAKAPEITRFLRDAGLGVSSIAAQGVMAPEDLTTLASEMTVLVSCWE